MSNIGQALPEAHSENPSGASSSNTSNSGARPRETHFTLPSSEHPYLLSPPPEGEKPPKEKKSGNNGSCHDELDEEDPHGFHNTQQPSNASLIVDAFQAKELNEKTEESQKCLDPRPTPFGKEKLYFDRTPTFSPDLSTNKGHPIHPDQIFEDEGGGDGLASMESDEDVLPCYETLQELLADEEGAKVFKKFLSENEQYALDFWCACNGLDNHTDDERRSLVPLIFKTFIRNNKIRIDKQTRSRIKERVEEDLNFDASVFDQAKLEVEKSMTDGAFIRFIKSDVYLNWLVHSKREFSDPSSPYEAQGGIASSSSMLPTVPEGNECVSDSSQKSVSRLTSGNLLATVKHRAIYDKYRSDSENRNYVSNPYYNGYASAINVSLQDSERQSMSSGARTDDNLSCTSGSLDGFNHRRLARCTNQRMLENARQNHESTLSSSLVKTTSLLTTKFAGKCPRPLAQTNHSEFANILNQRLLDLQQKQAQQVKLRQSLQKIPKHKEDISHQLRREHAEISMPPGLLQQRLAAEAVHQEDPNQQILDDHVARVFDSPDHAPDSPKQKSPPSHIIKNPKFPHFHPVVLTNYSMKSNYNSKNSSKMGRHQPSITQMSPSSSSLGYYQDASPLPGASNISREILNQPHFKNQIRNHSRRKEKGQEIYSTFSTDSGNASEYTLHYPSLPKSKSMPEYIENHGGASDGGSSGGSRPVSGNRRSMRHSCAETQEDSGISVVSDSIPSVGSSSLSADRISSWLAHSGEACNKGRSWTSHSIYPYVDSECRDIHKALGNRSTHTLAGSTSPGIQRRNGGSSGRRSQSSSSVSGSACTQYNAGSLPCQNPICQHYEQLRDSPTKYYSTNYAYERRKTRGGGSNSRPTKASSHGDSSGSNGSTLKKQQKIKHYEGMSPTSSSSIHCSSGSAPSPALIGHLSSSQAVASLPPSEYVVAVYNYADDEVPFTTKIPSRVVTLKKFKQHLPKKGNYRFFFKKFCDDIGVVMAEVTEDAEVLPLFDGRIFAQIRLVED